MSACETARKSVERFNRDLADARAGNSQWQFDDALANRAMLFASNLPNIKGPEADKPIRLMDWQRFVYANIFGFVEAGIVCDASGRRMWRCRAATAR